MSFPVNYVTLNADNFNNEVKKSNIPVIVDFWAPWCGPCRVMNPIILKIAEQYTGLIKVAKLNVDEFPHIASEYSIQAIPTLLFFQQGQVQKAIPGLISFEHLVEEVETLLDSVNANAS